MLSEAKLPNYYWGEAFYTTVQVLNLTPTISLNSEVLYKIWFGNNVKYDQLRVFGCKAFVHIPKDEISKLDAKSKQCIFIIYGKNVGYRLYDPIGKNLMKSHYVVFMEDQNIKDIGKVEKNTPKKDISFVVPKNLPSSFSNYPYNSLVRRSLAYIHNSSPCIIHHVFKNLGL